MQWERISPELKNLINKYLAGTFGFSTTENTEDMYRSGTIKLDYIKKDIYILKWKMPNGNYKTLGKIKDAT